MGRQYRQFTGVPECIRCCRSQADHDLRDAAADAAAIAAASAEPEFEVDDVTRRIWRALGWPCAQFVSTHGQIYAANQAAVSRWASRRPAVAPASVPGADPAIARRNAAAARAALLSPGHRTGTP